MDMHIEFHTKSGGHDDLRLTLSDMDLNVTADSYYLYLAAQDKVRQVGETDITDVLIAVLGHWIDALEHSGPTDSLCLPFAFYDQGIGCFQAQRDWEMVVLQYGFTCKEGWSVAPLNLGSFCTDVTDFVPTSAQTMRQSLGDLCAGIRHTMAAIQIV
ncbi:MAG: hypothetical protein AAF386_03480 [Pseudomonadota bacterium]